MSESIASGSTVGLANLVQIENEDQMDLDEFDLESEEPNTTRSESTVCETKTTAGQAESKNRDEEYDALDARLEIEFGCDVGNESENEQDAFDLEDLEAQFQFKNKRLQKQRSEAKAALVESYGSLADFRAHLPVSR